MTPAMNVAENILITKFTTEPLQALANYEFIEELKHTTAKGAVISHFIKNNTNIFAYILVEIARMNKLPKTFDNIFKIEKLENIYKIFLENVSFNDLIPEDHPDFILSYIETIDKYNFLDENDIGTYTINQIYTCSINDPAKFINSIMLHKKIMSIIAKIIKNGNAKILPQGVCNISFSYFIKYIPRIIEVVGINNILDSIDRIISASSAQLVEKQKVIKEILAQTPNLFDEINYKLQNNECISTEFIQLIRNCIIDNFGYLTELSNINNNNIHSLFDICKKLTIYIPYTQVIPYNITKKTNKPKRHTESNISIMQNLLDKNLIEPIDENVLPGKNPVILAASNDDFVMFVHLFEKINYGPLSFLMCNNKPDEIWHTYWDVCGESNNYVLYFIFNYLMRNNISFYNRMTLEKYIMPYICTIPSVICHIDNNIVRYMQDNLFSYARPAIVMLLDTIKYHDHNFKSVSHAFRYWLDLLNTKAKRGNAFNNIDNNAHRDDTYSYIKQEIEKKQPELNNIKKTNYPNLPPDEKLHHQILMQHARLVLLKYYLDNEPAKDSKDFGIWQALVEITKTQELVNKYKNSQYGIPFKEFAYFAASNTLIQKAIEQPRKDSKSTAELSEIPRLILAEIGSHENVSMFNTWDVDLDGNILQSEAATPLNVDEIKDLNNIYSCAVLLITQDIDSMLKDANIKQIITFLKPLVDKKAIDLRLELLQLLKNSAEDIPLEMYEQIKEMLLLQQQLMQAYFVNCLSEIRQDNSCVIGRISRVTLKVLMSHYLFARSSPEMRINEYFFEKWRSVAQISVSKFLLDRLALKLTLKQNSFKFLSTYPESITLTPEVYSAINKIINSKPQTIFAIQQQLTTFHPQLQMKLKAIMFPHKDKSRFHLQDDPNLCILFDTIFTLNQNNLPELFAKKQIVKASAGNKAKYEQHEYLGLNSIDIAPYNRNDFIEENFHHDILHDLTNYLMTKGEVLHDEISDYRSYVELNIYVGIEEIACKEIANNILGELRSLSSLPLDNIVTTYKNAIQLLNVNNSYYLTNLCYSKTHNRPAHNRTILIKQYSGNIANAIFSSLDEFLKLSTHPELLLLVKDKCHSSLKAIFAKILNDNIHNVIFMDELYKCNTFEDFFNKLESFIPKDTIEHNPFNEFHAFIKKIINSSQEIAKFNDILLNVTNSTNDLPLKINDLQNIFIKIQDIEHNLIQDNLLLKQILQKIIYSEELGNFNAKIKNFYCAKHFTYEFIQLCTRLNINITELNLQPHELSTRKVQTIINF